MIKLFCYSTLRLPQVIKEVLGIDPPHKKIEVFGHIDHFAHNYEDLMPGDEPVHGDIYEIDAKELKKLEKWEHENYRIEKLTSPSGETVLYFKMRPTSRAKMRMRHG
jgi:gamma-glutamylcyclotransferase (GGCT)/AIG2-like uncharacterized protein YtfP